MEKQQKATKAIKPAQAKPATLSKAEQRVEKLRILKEKAEVAAEGVRLVLDLRKVLQDKTLTKDQLDRMVLTLKEAATKVRSIASEY